MLKEFDCKSVTELYILCFKFGDLPRKREYFNCLRRNNVVTHFRVCVSTAT